MRNWRVITAIAAVVLAAIAGVLVWQYVDEADQRAEEDLEMVEILVARAEIAPGTVVGPSTTDADGDGDESDEPAASTSVPANALFETKEFVEQDVQDTWLRPGNEELLVGKIADVSVPPGLPIVQSMFIERGETDGFDGQIAEGKQAISISVDESHGVANFIQPEDSVNVLLTVDVKALEVQGGTPVKTTAFLLPAVKVLGVGQTTALPQTREVTRSRDTNGDGEINEDDDPDPVTPDEVRRGLLTLEVTPRQAEQIAQATALGTLYISLNPDGFDPAGFSNPEEIVEVINLFDQPLPRVEEALRLVAQAQAQR